MNLEVTRPAAAAPPLVIDLDGTLIRTDLLVGIFLRPSRRKSPSRLRAGVLDVRRQGAAQGGNRERHPDRSRASAIRPAGSLARPGGAGEWTTGSSASASNQRYVRGVAEHLGLFDGWFASTDSHNLSSSAKAKRLVEAFGEKGFDYVGNDRADLPAWSAANRRLAVAPSPSVKAALKAIDADALVLEPESGGLRAWLKLLRVHQWAKNGLVFVPVVTSHRFDLRSIAYAAIAAVAFSLAASSIYIIERPCRSRIQIAFIAARSGVRLPRAPCRFARPSSLGRCFWR